MDYFLNEFSLTGQFESVEAFYESFLKNTYYVLEKIDNDKDKIFKDEAFWSLNICNQYSVSNALNYKTKKNDRSGRAEMMRAMLRKVINNEPYSQRINDDPRILILEHDFDHNPEIDNTEKYNSIYYVASNNKNRRLVSFEHSCYLNWILRVKIIGDESNQKDVDLQNIYSSDCWEYVKEIKKWPLVAEEYWVEVRACEYTYHKPHFHVSSKSSPNQEMVFSIDDCSIIEPSENRDLFQWEKKMHGKIIKWYSQYKEDLISAWKMLHPPVF